MQVAVILSVETHITILPSLSHMLLLAYIYAQTACNHYGLDLNLQHAEGPLMGPKWGKNKFRLRKVEPHPHNQLLKADHLQQLHNCPKLMSARLVERLELQAQNSL